MKRITIIGGGASGTLVAANLLREAKGDVEINLVERKERIGRGVAFGTTRDSHLLNVPAGRMGAYPDAIDHFHKWLVENGHDHGPDDFVPRMKFGEYLRDMLTRAAERRQPAVQLNIIDDEAVDMSVNDSSADVILRSGEILQSTNVVLAFGNFKPPHPTVADQSFINSPKYFQDPWNSGLYESLNEDDSIFIIGTGLSMIDVALHLHRNGHKGKITALSTRGLLPATHQLGHTYESFYEEIRSMRRITDILKSVRKHARKADSNGSNWRAAIDSLRPVTQQLWLDLPLAEKKYFKQHLSRYWDVARHRMPSEVRIVLDEMRDAGSLEIFRGRLTAITNVDGGFTIAFSTPQGEKAGDAKILVNCIGSESCFSKVDSTFVRNLIARKHIRDDELNFGIDATADGRVIGKTGRPSSVVFTLGTALKGILWESTAIPEIRTQARALALQLLA
jgi:uncharacterized NAD(P)/FAD-binding protein YdhS